ncbi:MAG: AmmeMemoRadiSam system protein B [Candidatus Omnitrophica bacterium]|nr:AmmeMemoRadiSam system protein B [Candidatus Omnitrophota bacterium]
MVKIVGFFVGLIVSFSAYSQIIKDYEFAGSFYPKDEKELAKQVDFYLNMASSSVEGEVLGIISPHAGYVFSGEVAGFSYKILEGKKFDSVVLLGPSHHYLFKGMAIWEKGAFSTPLGVIKIDEALARELSTLECVSFEKKYFFHEHCLEVQLPFLMRVLKDFKIVPVLFGKVLYQDLERFATRLMEASCKKRILIVVSTDLSHYHPYQEAVKIDRETISYIERKDATRLWLSLQLNEQRACGIYPLISFLIYANKVGAEVKILKYANSGDAYPSLSKERVVGYLSAVIYKKDKEDAMSDHQLTKDEKVTLLKIARATLESYLKEGKLPKFEVDSPRLKEKRGVFVTLKKEGDLRGCIGRIVADTPLYEAVSKMAIESATGDPRFPPVRWEELKDIEIEISVLSPFEKVESLDEIQVGRDGLMIRKGLYSGLLLPQVPLEYNWDKITFLQHLCLKAGLPPQAYKGKDVTIYKFTALVFSESELMK